ncbi:glycoside hydrolase family 3 C-terminal domain-containing protein [Dermacoccaceae bacterium W4C1]
MSLQQNVIRTLLALRGGQDPRQLDRDNMPELAPVPPHAGLRRRCQVVDLELAGRPVTRLVPRAGGAGPEIVYWPGGAYVSPASRVHWWILDALIRRTDARVTVPHYALAPHADFDDVVPLGEAVQEYAAAHRGARPYVIAGDSAGGALAISHARAVAESDCPADLLLLLAPWVDARMGNPEARELQDQDPILDIDALATTGRWWAGERDPGDAWVSPVEADLSGLPPTQVVMGDRDVFLPDVRRFVARATEAGVPTQLRVDPGGYHVHVATPWTPEARAALDEVGARISALAVQEADVAIDPAPGADPQVAQADQLDLVQQVQLLSGADSWRTANPVGAQVPTAMLSDGPHGLRVEQPAGGLFAPGEPATCFPPAVTLASTWDQGLVERVGAAIGAEARDLGVDVVLGPGMNIKRHPGGGRNFEYFSEDPLVSGTMAAAMVNGIQSQGVGACVKHFAVNSAEHFRFVIDAVVDERTLREIYLSGFEHAVRTAAPWSVMCAYNGVNGQPCSQNHRLLTEILREEWGFGGLVMSDWGAVVDRAAGVAAGLDLEMPGGHGMSDQEVIDAVAAGSLSAEAVRTSAQRVLELAARAPAYTERVAIGDQHDGLARTAAAAGTVLLSNDGTLPLTAGCSVALIGEFATRPRFQGGGSSQVNAVSITTALEALQQKGFDVAYEPGYSLDGSTGELGSDPQALIERAAAAAARADVAVVMVGLPDAYETEGIDRGSLSLPAEHDQLVHAVLAANPRTVVALSNGSPVLLPWRDQVSAVLECYLGGQAGGGAVADVLAGDVDPGGRLAETFPLQASDVAADPWFPGQTRQVQYREGQFVGYRHHVSSGVPQAFPFGYGLSYARFEWSRIEVLGGPVTDESGVSVRLQVSNVGDRAGSDVVQVYLSEESGFVLRPRRWLAGYAKVSLEPGQVREVEIALEPRRFAHYDPQQQRWARVRGQFLVQVSRSSAEADQVVVVPVPVEGEVTAPSPDAGAAPVAATDEEFARRLGHPIPTPTSPVPFTRNSTFAELSASPAGRAFTALAWRVGPGRTVAKDSPMVRRAFTEAPLRAAARLSGGKLSWRVVDAVVAAANLTRRR